MANIKKLKANGQDIVPITHEQAVLDSNGVTLDSKLNAINNAISRLENNSTPSTPNTPSTPSLEGNIKILTIGNYTIKYNETDDTLDFIYNGATDVPDVPTTEEVVPLTWAVGNLSGTDGSETVQENSLRSSFATIVSGSTYSFYLDTSFYDPSGVRVYFYDTNKTFISRTDGNVIGYESGKDISIDVPTNAAYMRFKANASGTTVVDTIGSLFTLKRKTKANDEIVIPTWNDNTSLDSVGNITNNTECILSDLIKIDSNYNYTINYNANVLNLRIASYNSSQTFISRSEYLTSGNVDTIITFPENAGYFRVKADKGSSTVNEANDNIIIKKVKKVNKVNSYVTEGLSMYIDASDVASYGSVRDITGKQSIVNHGVSTTLDNGCLNFVASESDYLDCGFKPNLTKWSAEVYFYYTDMPTGSETVLAWGAKGSDTIVAHWSGNDLIIVVNNHSTPYRIISVPTSLTHLILTYNNGAIIAYVNGVKTELATNASVMTSQGSNLLIGSSFSIKSFADMHLKSLRFYDGKVLSDEEALQNYNYEIKNTYVTNGLSLYIDAQDVATQGSVRDIIGKQNITNHGVSTTLDNGCLNFVASESDYIDCGFKPNLTKWSAEVYFYFTATPTSAETVLGWGASGNRTAIAFWGNSFMIVVSDNAEHTITSTPPTSLTHIVLTYNNGTIIAYVNGAKSQITTSANVMTSQAGNLMVGTKYSAAGEFGNIHLKSLRFYDGKVLTEEEALQNYNYEINRNVIKPTWKTNMKLDTSTGLEVASENNACTEFISYDSSYTYTLAIDTVTFFRVYYYDSSQSYIKNDSIADNFNGVITPPSNTAYIRLKLGTNNMAVSYSELDNHVVLKKVHK